MTYLVTRDFDPSFFDKIPTIKIGFRIIPREDFPGTWVVVNRKGERITVINDIQFAKIGKRREGDTLLTEIGRQLRKARIARGLTQDELGQKLRASRNYINQIEAGKASCSFEKIQQICDAIDYQITIKITRKYGQENVRHEPVTKIPDSL